MRSPVAAIAVSALAVAAIVGVLVWLDIDEQLLELLRWIDGQGLWAALWFVAIMALVVVCLLPGVLFTTGAGFVFGVVEGTVYVVLGTTLGACLAFLIARYGAGDRARAFIRRHAGLHAVTREMEAHDFQVVLLTRLIPFSPASCRTISSASRASLSVATAWVRCSGWCHFPCTMSTSAPWQRASWPSTTTRSAARPWSGRFTGSASWAR